jgi:hypothetical protein
VATTIKFIESEGEYIGSEFEGTFSRRTLPVFFRVAWELTNQELESLAKSTTPKDESLEFDQLGDLFALLVHLLEAARLYANQGDKLKPMIPNSLKMARVSLATAQKFLRAIFFEYFFIFLNSHARLFASRTRPANPKRMQQVAQSAPACVSCCWCSL